jgi:uncharacterized UBP type Zn finger protein
MSDAHIERNKLLWNDLRNETNVAAAIRQIADLGEQATAESIRDREAIRKEMHMLREASKEEYRIVRKTLVGNGDPSHSVVARLERIEECLKDSKTNRDKFWWIVIPILLAQIVQFIMQLP